MVFRDLCMGIVLQQLIVVLLAALIWALDPNRDLSGWLLGLADGSTSQLELSKSASLWTYYGFGWFAFFVGLDLFGSTVMCMNGCDCERAISSVGTQSERSTTTSIISQANSTIQRAGTIARNSYQTCG